MAYHDDPGDTSPHRRVAAPSEALEYRDDPECPRPEDHEFDSMPAPQQRSVCISPIPSAKTLLTVCLVVALLLGSYELGHSNQGQGGIVATPKVGVSDAPKIPPVAHSGDYDHDEGGGIPSAAEQQQDQQQEKEQEQQKEQPQQHKQQQQQSLGGDGQIPAQPSQPARPAKPMDECADDDSFVFKNLKTCQTFIARVGRVPLHNARCATFTGVFTDNGEELQAKHICRYSCGLCGDGPWAEKVKEEEVAAEAAGYVQVEEEKQKKEADEEKEEFAENLEELVHEEQDGGGNVELVLDEGQSDLISEVEAPMEESEEDKLEDAELWNELEEEENEEVEEAETVYGDGGSEANETEADEAAPVAFPPGCSAQCYLANNPEVEDALPHPDDPEKVLAHYLYFGAKGGRDCACGEEGGGGGLGSTEGEGADINGPQGGEDGEPLDESDVDDSEYPVAVETSKEEDPPEEAEGKSADSPIPISAVPEGGSTATHAQLEVELNEPTSGEDKDQGEGDDSPLITEIDYFVPMTELEKDAMKERLRGVLRITKDALALTSTMGQLPDNLKHSMTIQHERTLVLGANVAKQFMHLQHNQTGSDDVDDLISCALERQNALANNAILYSTISECTNLAQCMNDLASRLGAVLVDGEMFRSDPEGNPTEVLVEPNEEGVGATANARNVCGTLEAGVMEYCTSLDVVRSFGWKGVDSIAMFDNPVKRIHRMYQVTAQQCYECKELKDVLKEISAGMFNNQGGKPTLRYKHDNQCATQMIGHMGTQLLSSPYLYKEANNLTFPVERQIVEEAIRNVRSEQITWIGNADAMEESIDGFRVIFPWLSENLNVAAKTLGQEFASRGEDIGDDKNFGISENYLDQNGCVFKSRIDEDRYTCGTRELDDETMAWIKKLNMRDLAVYKAAKERFRIQQEVIREYRESLQ